MLTLLGRQRRCRPSRLLHVRSLAGGPAGYHEDLGRVLIGDFKAARAILYAFLAYVAALTNFAYRKN